MADPIQLTDAAKYYKQEPQQVSAFEWLQQQQTAETMAEFAETSCRPLLGIQRSRLMQRS